MHTRTTLRRRTDARSLSALGLFEAMSEAIVLLDHAGMIANLNPAAELMFGCAAGDAQGKSASDLFDISHSEVMRMVANRMPLRQHLAVKAEAGALRIVRAEVMEVSPAETGGANWSAVICTPLEEAPTVRAPDPYLRALSRELRDPLKPIAGALAAMRSIESTDPVLAHNCAILERQFTRLGNVVSGLTKAVASNASRLGRQAPLSARDGALPMRMQWAAAPARSGSGKIASNRDFRILLIDDNFDANESTASLLRLLEYDVRTAGDAANGLAASLEFEPHLILSDIGLPGMDGYALARALRRAAGTRKLLLAAATGYGMANDRARAQEAGFDFHFVKPLDADVLLEFIAQQAAAF